MRWIYANSGWASRMGLHIGFQPPLCKVSGPKGFFRQPTGGLAVLIQKQIPSAIIPFPSNLQYLHRYCLPIWVSLAHGSSGLSAINCFLPTGNPARATREEILHDIFSFASLYDHCPVIIGGGLQMDTSESSCVAQALCSGLWFDFNAHPRASNGEVLEATFSAGGWNSGCLVGPGRTRLDHLLLNHFAVVAAKETSVFRGPLAPGHCPVNLQLDIDVFGAECMTLTPIENWKLPPRPKNPETWDSRNSQCLPILKDFLPNLIEHAESFDVCAFWDTTCNMIHDMLNSISGQSIPKVRGVVPTFRKTQIIPPPAKISGIQSRTQKVRRAIHELVVKCKYWKPLHPAFMVLTQTTVHNINRYLVSLGCPVIEPDMTLEPIQKFIQHCSHHVIQYEASVSESQSRERIKTWKETLQLSHRKDKRHVFRWLKNDNTHSARVLSRQEGSLTGDPNEILDMLTNHIGQICNTHANVDEDSLYQIFLEKCRTEINALQNSATVPDFCASGLWSFFQKKPEYRSGGLDRWKVVETQALPVCAWEVLALFYRLVEHTGIWPPSFKVVPITAIPKTKQKWTPETTRAIGLASVFYSCWSSMRYKHLSSWMTQLAPASLLGGLPNRNATASELSLSSELFEEEFFEGDARKVLFVDRLKCFDLLLPNFCFSLASDLGIPTPIINGIKGFYHGQVKCFKFRLCFGPTVVQNNGLLQGCAFSVLFANLIFSVFAKHIESKTLNNFASFIDDTKLWAKLSDFQTLVEAANDLSVFDSAVGQIQNDKKSLIMTKKEKNAQRFLLQVGKKMPKAKDAKSLGFFHKTTRRGNAKKQDARLQRAIKVVGKVSKLPLPATDKAFYIKSNAHSIWVYGSEVQGPSKGAFKNFEQR